MQITWQIIEIMGGIIVILNDVNDIEYISIWVFPQFWQ